MRAAALSSLARFGAQCPDLRDRVLQLVRRALYDNDDEVRAGCAWWRVALCTQCVLSS